MGGIFYCNLCLRYDVLISHPTGGNRNADVEGDLGLSTVVFSFLLLWRGTRDSREQDLWRAAEEMGLV